MTKLSVRQNGVFLFFVNFLVIPIVLFVLVFGFKYTANPVNVQAQSVANFSVQNGQILAPSGEPFVAKGVNVNGYNWGWPGSNIDFLPLLDERCWDFNVVRLPNKILPQPAGSAIWDDNNDLDAIVASFTSKNIVVVLNAHDRIGGYYTGQEFEIQKDWFRDLATRYKNNPYVWFNLQNEPDTYTPNKSLWVAKHQELISIIRDEVGANNVIVVDDVGFGQGINRFRGNYLADSAVLSNGQDLMDFNSKAYSNIVFSIHVYDAVTGSSPDGIDGERMLKDYLDESQSKGLAILIGEFGSENNGDSTILGSQRMYKQVVNRNIGRIVWAWWGGDGNDLTESGNGGGQHINDCQTPTNLSWLGQMVWADNQANNSNYYPVTRLSSSTDLQNLQTNSTINLSAQAFDLDGAVSRVEFFNGDQKVGEDNDASDGFSLSYIPTVAGNYSIQARVFDNQGLSSFAPQSLDFNVNQAASNNNGNTNTSTGPVDPAPANPNYSNSAPSNNSTSVGSTNVPASPNTLVRSGGAQDTSRFNNQALGFVLIILVLGLVYFLLNKRSNTKV